MALDERELHTYVINLARATERMKHMQSELDRLNLPFTRIEAVLGDELPEPIKNFDERQFNIRTGKHANKREIGCYFSHIQALRRFLETDARHALILEDDINLPDSLESLLDAAIQHGSHWDLLRLTSSRQGEYIKIAELDEIHQLAYNTRVLKNTGAYLINRHAAQKCLKHLLPMRLPYDVALDRDWACGFKTACITPFPIELEDFPGQIPKAPRIRVFRSTTFHLFHLSDRISRIRYRRSLGRKLSQTSDR